MYIFKGPIVTNLMNMLQLLYEIITCKRIQISDNVKIHTF